MSQQRQIHGTRRAAFTLVELLVVLGIIGVLIALLLPSLNRARNHARRAHCAANLRSIGQALTMYVQHYRYYPACNTGMPEGATRAIYGGVWPVRLRPFLGGDQKVFHCPSRDERFEWTPNDPWPRAEPHDEQFGFVTGEPLLVGSRRFSYGYNAWGTRDISQSKFGLGARARTPLEAQFNYQSNEVHASRVRFPSKMIAVTDSDGDGFLDFESCPYGVGDHRRTLPGNVHDRGANVLFCDGHVEWFLQKDLLRADSGGRSPDHAVRRMWNNDHSTGYPFPQH